MASLADRVKEMRSAIWEKEPKEVGKALVEAEGTFGTTFFPAMYAVEWSRNMHMMLVDLRKVALDEASDVGTVRLFATACLQGPMLSSLTYAGMDETRKQLENVGAEISGVKTRRELVAVVSELTLYVGRLNYWLDQGMPWYELVMLYEKMKKDIRQ
jgi:hypothetical protein